ncbi:hypothetical protein ACU8KH_04144 [Lachancea thermotolerans]
MFNSAAEKYTAPLTAFLFRKPRRLQKRCFCLEESFQFLFIKGLKESFSVKFAATEELGSFADNLSTSA